jgi:hypothetical protein
VSDAGDKGPWVEGDGRKGLAGLGTALRLALLSLAAGLVLAALVVTPGELLERAAALGRGLWELASGALEWAGSYMLLGALVVVPLWLAGRVWRHLRGR